MFSIKNITIVSACYNEKQKRSQTIINLAKTPKNSGELQSAILAPGMLYYFKPGHIFFCSLLWFTVYRR